MGNCSHQVDPTPSSIVRNLRMTAPHTNRRRQWQQYRDRHVVPDFHGGGVEPSHTVRKESVNEVTMAIVLDGLDLTDAQCTILGPVFRPTRRSPAEFERRMITSAA